VPEDADLYSAVDLESPFPVDRRKKFFVKTNKWISEKDFDFFDGEHSLFDNLTHKRMIFFDKIEQGWILKDILIGGGENRSKLYFHFYPQPVKQCVLSDSLSVIYTDNKNASNLALLFAENDIKMGITSVRLEKAWYSPLYGSKKKNIVATFEHYGALPHDYSVIIIPFFGHIEESLAAIRVKKEKIIKSLGNKF
jgi:hypothetical protein